MTQFLFGLPFSYRQRKLGAARTPLQKEEFVTRIVTEGGDAEAAGMVWDALIAEWTVGDFTPYPDDSLSKVFGIAEEELDEDLIARILKELNVPLPQREVTERFGAIDSPRRIAMFVSECRRGRNV